MKAAIYARKSTDDNARREENKSVVRQVEHARAYAAARGWTVAEEHVYVDDGISGAEFRNRPALLRMLNHLRSFEVIVMSELSRLGRDQIQTAQCLANIEAAGVRVFFYLTNEELRFTTAVDRFLVNAVSFAAELEREKASQRARDALTKKARAGYVAGGACYGYDLVPIYVTAANGTEARSHTEYRINEAQAEVVRTIFRMYADGLGYDTVAKVLNGDPEPRYWELNLRYVGGKRVPSPTAGKRGTGSWSVSALHEMLRRPRYIGRIVYGAHRNITRNGRARQRVRQAQAPMTKHPGLQIVPQELWDAVQAKLKERRDTYLTHTRGNSYGRAGRAGESRWLLSGLARCGECGASMIVVARNGSRPYYGCSYHKNRGNTACANGHLAQVPNLDRTVLTAIEETVLTPTAMDYVTSRALELLGENASDPRDQLDRQIRELVRQQDNLVAALADGRAVPESVIEKIREVEDQRRAAEAQRVRLATIPMDQTTLERRVKAAAVHWKDCLRADVAGARKALRALLVAPVRCKPLRRPDGRTIYAVEGETAAGALFGGERFLEMASPRGFEPRLPP
jgi:DNA invertase Pin-like site-specific DNA recombinase